MSLVIHAGFVLEDLGGFELGVVEDGGNTYSIDFPSGRHFLDVDATDAVGDYASQVTDHTSFCARLLAAFSAQSITGDWDVVLNLATKRITITCGGGGGTVTEIQLTPISGGEVIGITSAKTGALTYEMDVAPYFVIVSAMGAWAQTGRGEYRGGKAKAHDTEAHDGTPGGVMKRRAPKYLDFVVPMEPVAVCGNYPELVDAEEQPWTWDDLFEHVGNVRPLAIVTDYSEIGAGESTRFVRLRADNTLFEPQERGDGYIGHFDIPLRTRILGRLPAEEEE